MAGKKKNVQSEHTKEMATKEVVDLQKKIKGMTAEELKAFRNGFDPDQMGFFGEESV